MFNKHQNTSEYLEDDTIELYTLYCPHQSYRTLNAYIHSKPWSDSAIHSCLNASLFNKYTFLAKTRMYHRKAQHSTELSWLPSAALPGWAKLDFVCYKHPLLPCSSSTAQAVAKQRHWGTWGICCLLGGHNKYLLLSTRSSCCQCTDLEQGLLGAKNCTFPLNLRQNWTMAVTDVNLFLFNIRCAVCKLQMWQQSSFFSFQCSTWVKRNPFCQ